MKKIYIYSFSIFILGCNNINHNTEKASILTGKEMLSASFVNNKHTLKDIDYWLKQSKWLSDKILPGHNAKELCVKLKHRRYKHTINDLQNKLTIEFLEHNYTKWYATIDFGACPDKGQIVLETGYY